MLFHVGQGFILMFPMLGVGAPKVRFFRTHKGSETAPPSPSSAHRAESGTFSDQHSFDDFHKNGTSYW